MSDVNIPLLRKAVEWVEEQDKLHPEKRQWNQGVYVEPEYMRVILGGAEVGCGTAYCVAGYIGSLVDERFIDSAWVDGPGPSCDKHVSTVAQEALGLADHQADLLFYGGNSSQAIRRLAEEFAGEKL